MKLYFYPLSVIAVNFSPENDAILPIDEKEKPHYFAFVLI